MNSEVVYQIFRKEDIDPLLTDTGNALGLPPEAYYTEGAFAFEREHIFKKRWMAAGFASSLPDVGSALPVRFAGWELVFVRGGDGKVRCFHNICRHRGTKVVMEAGTFKTLSCPWHAWTYGLDGKLKATPNIGGQGVHTIVELDKETHGLSEVKCDQWLDLLFIDIGGEAEPFADYIAPLAEALREFDLSELTLGAAGDRFEVKSNWKIVIESGIEGYHLPVIHPTLRQPQRYDYSVGADTYVRQAQNVVNYKNSALGGTLGKKDDGPRFRKFPHMQAVWEEDGPLPLLHYYLPPSVVISVLADMITFALFTPLTPTTTGFTRRFYFIGDSADSPELADLRASVATSMDAIGKEDMAVMENAQSVLSLRKELEIPTRFSPYWEGGVHNFQKFYLNMFR
ncbi:aromatic ring-hydroxylating dioxygenase subunit alpha [Caballeronia sp. LjRoot34]|uniref:SRPBCC family protein n=1 Tax=Caballeronia sp. LjRoot34 TaxID=3342325 RepID=UPI003ED1421D